jgi:D-alanine transaminase
MSGVVWVNGAFVAAAEARVSVFDRGFLFADAVYEVVPVLGGRLVDLEGHLARLDRSLAALGIPRPSEPLTPLLRETVARNALEEGIVYLQVTRGAAPRDFAIPRDATPTLVAFTQARPLRDAPSARTGLRVVTRPDWRWARRDIKTTQLLAASLMKQEALDAGADDCWMVDARGLVTEGSSSNAWIVTAAGTLATRDLSADILAGVTRAGVAALADEAGLKVEQRAFGTAEAQCAAEAFVTAASSFVTPVVSIDGVPVGDGRPGPVTRRLRAALLAAAEAAAV